MFVKPYLFFDKTKKSLRILSLQSKLVAKLLEHKLLGNMVKILQAVNRAMSHLLLLEKNILYPML